MENDNKISRFGTEGSILYELLVYSEWKQEPELPKILNVRHEGLVALLKGVFPFSRENDLQLSAVERLLNWQQPWRLAVGDGGKVVAIIQEGSLEIRSSRDEYSSVIGKAGLPKDLFPQWRRWCWSPDCSILALGFSNGSICAYDLMGSNLFTICPATCQLEQVSVVTRHAFAACFFVQARATTQKWSSELVTVDYRGELHNYLVSPTEGFQESHCFSFNQYYRFGVTAVAYHPMHSILFIAGPTGTRADPSMQDHGSGVGLTAWRMLNDYPFYKPVSSDKTHDSGFLSESFWNQFPSLRNKSHQSIVVRMELSPSAKLLAAIHSCGGVSVWSIPALRKLAFWPLLEQPGWNLKNPFNIEITTQPIDRKSEASGSIENFYPIDLDWWSDDIIVLSRNSGAVSVCDISTLTNLLGESPEFLAGAAQVRRFHNQKGFLALECETETLSKNRTSGEDLEEQNMPEHNEDESDEAQSTFLTRITTILRFAAYLVTDLERFRPKRKRLRLFRRTYRLLALRSTTPEELFSRKLDSEEYGEALTLAVTYNLDCDLVYQRQWRNSKVSVASIRDYLSKVSKQMWVLQECIERVPESLLASRELLEFGLKATCQDAFRNLGNKRKVRDVSDMTEEQRQLLAFRHTLLHYQDRLTTYEKILGGAQLADELFEYTAYAEFRSASSLRACVQFARAANCQAVECMLTYHSSQTQQHWLPILSNIPETISPTEYRSLLPECSSEGVLFPLKESCLRDLDWSEKDPYSFVGVEKIDTVEEDNECLYQFEPSLSAYRGAVSNLTPDLVQQWYCERIRAIERSSRMVDNALTLLRLAQDRNVEGLESLHQELKTLDALVYELYLEDISLEDLEKKSPLEKCKLLMSKTSEDTFVSDLKNFLFQFLDRIEKQIPGKRCELLHCYLVSLSSKDLLLPWKFFNHCSTGEDFGGVTHADQVSLAQACLYAYLGTDQLHLAHDILACIPRSRETLALYDVIDTLEKELSGCLILQRNHTAKTLGYLRDNKNDVQTVMQLLTRMARTIAHSTRPPSEAVWSTLLKDILDLQQSVFACIPVSSCYEIFCSTLLSSGDLFSIKLAGKYLTSNLKSNELSLPQGNSFHISFNKSQALLLAAAREYVDSSGSLTDPAMELALACLHLAHNEDEEVKEELNLISSFELLHEFGIVKLPLQVRLCPDRLQLIDECLKKKHGAHRSFNRLLQLAACLNICGNDFRLRQGRVLVLVAESALSVNDLRCCGEVCQRIVASGYAAGWQVVSQLGCCGRFNDLSLRAQLLAFALLHCPSEYLQELLCARCSLEVERLQHFVNKQLTLHNVSLTTQLEDPSLTYVPESGKADFLQSLQIGELTVRETTQRLLSCVGDSSFWKKAFRLGSDMEEDMNSFQASVSRDNYVCHAFYLSLFESVPCSTSMLGPCYDSFAAPDTPLGIQLQQSLLQISLLEQECGLEEGNTARILVECARSLLPEDNCLGLAHLLAVPEPLAKEACDRVFGSKLTAVNLKLAQYHAALLQYRNFVSGKIEKLHDAFSHDPIEVINFVRQKASPHDTWVIVLNDWRMRLIDFLQDHDLLHLDCGIDVERFSSDEQYRHDSIIGLAMSDESEKVNFALVLASRYNINRGEVIAEHIVSLILSDLPAADIKSKIEGSQMLEMIKEAPQEIRTKLESMVLPILNGKQIEHLEICYEILNQVAPADRCGRLLPKDHLKLLSKIRATSAAIDYKLLISGPKYTLQAVETSLTAENIPLVAKLLKAMPPALASSLTSSQLYGIFIRRQLHACPDEQQSVESLCPLLKNMTSSDILNLMRKVYFVNDKSEVYLSVDLLNSAIICSDSINDEDCRDQLKRWKHHIEVAKCLLQKWPDDPLCRSFFSSQGESDALSNLVHTILFSEEKPLELVLDIMNAANICSFEEVVSDLLRKVHESLSEQEACDWHNLSVLLLRIEQYIASSNYAYLSNKDWEALLHPMVSTDVLPPHLRLRVLQLLQSIKSEEIEESALLLPHTRAIVASAWPETSLQLSNIQEEESRASVLLNLLHSTKNWQQRDALRRLLALWPSFSKSSDSLGSGILYEMLSDCIKCDKGTWSDQKASFIIDISKNIPINFSCVEKILLDFEQDSTSYSDDEDEASDEQVDVQLLLLVCLLCEDSKAHLKAVTLAQHRLMEPLHDQVAELTLARQLVVDLISTPAYSDLLAFVLTSHPEQADNIIRTLINRKYIPEAGAVILQSVKSVPRFMRTFSASLMAGLSKQFESSVSHSKLVNLELESPTEGCITKQSPSNIVQGSALQVEDNDWDVSDEAWCNIDESSSQAKVSDEIGPAVGSTAETTSSPTEILPSPKQDSSVSTQSVDTLSTKIAFPEMEVQKEKEGWGDWSDDELECSAGEAPGRAFIPTASHSPSPLSSTSASFLPSSRSAFVRVPPRDQKKINMQESLQSHHTEETQPDQSAAAPGGWGDHSDDNWEW